jgi:hypothetical protein
VPAPNHVSAATVSVVEAADVRHHVLEVVAFQRVTPGGHHRRQADGCAAFRYDFLDVVVVDRLLPLGVVERARRGLQRRRGGTVAMAGRAVAGGAELLELGLAGLVIRLGPA